MVNSIFIKQRLLHKALSDYYELSQQLAFDVNIQQQPVEDRIVHLFQRNPLRSIQVVLCISLISSLVMQVNRSKLLSRVRPGLLKVSLYTLALLSILDILCNAQPLQSSDLGVPEYAKEIATSSVQEFRKQLSLAARSDGALTILLALYGTLIHSDATRFLRLAIAVLSIPHLIPALLVILAVSSSQFFSGLQPLIAQWWKAVPTEEEDIVNEKREEDLTTTPETAVLGGESSTIYRYLHLSQQIGGILAIVWTMHTLSYTIRTTKDTLTSLLRTTGIFLMLLSYVVLRLQALSAGNGIFEEVSQLLLPKLRTLSVSDMIGHSSAAVHSAYTSVVSLLSSVISAGSGQEQEGEVGAQTSKRRQRRSAKSTSAARRRVNGMPKSLKQRRKRRRASTVPIISLQEVGEGDSAVVEVDEEVVTSSVTSIDHDESDDHLVTSGSHLDVQEPAAVSSPGIESVDSIFTSTATSASSAGESPPQDDSGLEITTEGEDDRTIIEQQSRSIETDSGHNTDGDYSADIDDDSDDNSDDSNDYDGDDGTRIDSASRAFGQENRNEDADTGIDVIGVDLDTEEDYDVKQGTDVDAVLDADGDVDANGYQSEDRESDEGESEDEDDEKEENASEDQETDEDNDEDDEDTEKDSHSAEGEEEVEEHAEDADSDSQDVSEGNDSDCALSEPAEAQHLQEELDQEEADDDADEEEDEAEDANAVENEAGEDEGSEDNIDDFDAEVDDASENDDEEGDEDNEDTSEESPEDEDGRGDDGSEEDDVDEIEL